jgi:hypothetical protein
VLTETTLIIGKQVGQNPNRRCDKESRNETHEEYRQALEAGKGQKQIFPWSLHKEPVQIVIIPGF